MRPLHIIMPMAGEGSRFLKKGITIPKPLIPCKEKTLFERALMSLDDIACNKKHSFIVRQVHIVEHDIEMKIKSIIPGANVFSVKQTTRGAVETCMLAKDTVDSDDAIVIMDCDLEFYSKSYNEYISAILQKLTNEVDGGALVSFDSSDPRYSFALADTSNRVIRTAEKEVISNHALAGAYFFSKASSFLNASERLLQKANFGSAEFYVSLLYNDLIANGEYVFLAKTDKYYSYGTPEELRRYQNEG